jgi:hypothetical protein
LRRLALVNLSVVSTITFNIGEAFPASDPIARFVTTLAMMSNDVNRSFAFLDPEGDAGEQMWLFRHQASLFNEAASFIADTAHHYSAVEAFVSQLPPEARDEQDRIVGGVDPTSPHYVGAWLSAHRHATFHYPKMHPAKAERGEERVMQALDAASGQEGQITFDATLGSFRCGFADTVASQWLPNDDELDTIIRLREALLALVRFTQRALTAHNATRPEDTFRDGP